jgi:hypothetical protein
MIGAEIELAAPIGARDSPLKAYTEAPNFSAGRRQFGKKNRPPERDKRIKPPFSTWWARCGLHKGVGRFIAN